jgi:cation diffusion facilitator CzcD-associated flavoprotein CzcO
MKRWRIQDNIIYQQRALCYNFDTKEKLWTITTENTSTAEETIYTCQFLAVAVINYARVYPRIYRSIEVWRKIIHPQKWPENLNIVDKTIIVIGSGAAVTIVPELAAEAKMVTMLQRSPTYIAALPNKDKVAARIKRLFPKR